MNAISTPEPMRTGNASRPALFTGAAYHSVEMAAAFTICDSLAELDWETQFSAGPTKEGLEKLYRAALHAVLA